MRSVTVLERALIELEDYHFLNKAAGSVNEAIGGSSHYPELHKRIHNNFPNFRQYLQDSVSVGGEYDAERFGSYDELDDHINPAASVAFGLYSWVRGSRRIFSVDNDLKLLLDATSLEEIELREVQFPFSSFLVEIPKPFVGAHGQPFRYAVFTDIPGPDGKRKIKWCMLADTQLDYKPLSIIERSDLLGDIKNKNWSRAGRKVTQLQKRMEEQRWQTGGLNWMNPEEPISSIIDGLQQEGHEFVSAWMRVVFGMCLYLKSLPAESKLVSPWRKTERVPSPRGAAVSSDAQICSVESSFKLSREERDAFSDPAGQPTRSFGEKCCHFRRGTWCRPKKSAPGSLRTEWRRPTIVRADKLLPGELPQGAQAILGL